MKPEPIMGTSVPTTGTLVEPTLASAVQTMADILRELKTSSKGDDSRIDVLASGIQTLIDHEKARPRENPQYPGISGLNPLGELAHPRPELRCKMFWVGYRLNKDMLTHEEIDLLNKVTPGEYRVTKSDGTMVPFTVDGKQDLAGRLERLTFHFPCKNTDDRMNHMPMISYLREAMGEALPSVDRLMAQVRALKAELALKGA